ncbi:Flp pilus assembly complex ATPase component TadA [Candidatus Woesearchaeota archaeon]|nr:Flp pilus assembly complex ATPase component TadA [Candidatus Woesearchaeota archaeon]
MDKQMNIERITPDTNILIEGFLSKKIENKEYKIKELIIHEAVLAELEHQANQEKAIGYLGLEELKRLRELSGKFEFNIKYAGQRPKPVEIKYASLGEIDSLIRALAYEQDSTLITSDKVQHKVAEARGVKVIYIKVEDKARTLKLDKLFDATTMSVHLKEEVLPFAKKGVPGNWEFVKIKDKPFTQEEIQEISTEIIENTKIRRDSFIEIERMGSTIVQLGPYRIVITKPPFSDGWEITAVRPVKKLTLEEYALSDKLKERIERAEGVLIAGAPGMGKSTAAAALAEYYVTKGKIVKTVEAPRDLILSNEITQYALSHADAQEIHDVLLLSRPDYTIFDEMRNTSDFRLFADLRLAGIGFLGVIHATNPIDAIQRFIGRVELGVIPQIIDTVIFIKNGLIDKVLSLKMTVKVPSGMTEADLARPLVTVSDFETGKTEYEIYSYGEETVVVPVNASERFNPAKQLAAKSIEEELKRHVGNVKAEVVGDNKAIVYIPERDIASIIGKEGKNIEQIEKKLGLHIDVRPLEEEHGEEKPVKFDAVETGKYILIYVDTPNKPVDTYIDDVFLFTSTSSKKGEIKVHKKSKLGKALWNALTQKRKIEVKTTS